MRILHTSDWHIGRTFHGHSTLTAVTTVLSAIADLVRERHVDVVIAAGDVFDSATPSGDAFDLLQKALLGLREAGATVVLTSGNHDSPARLGFAAPFARLAGVVIATDPDGVGVPIPLEDEHGPVDFYAIPYLEPALLRHRWPDEQFRNQADAMRFAMGRVRASATERRRAGARSVAVAHTFAAGGEAASADSERPIVVGTVDVVPLSVFDGVDYVALGHIHGRATLAEGIRYSGAILHYSFGEAGKPRGGWLVDLDADGVASVEWVDVPVPRPLAVLTGELDALLGSAEFAPYEDHWVSAILTDTRRPLEAMRKLQTRFPWCANVEHRPAAVVDDGRTSYAERVQGKTDPEILEAFLAHVRGGDGPSPEEAELFAAVLTEQGAKAVTA
ncbi:MAG TPA: exonuclease SbcCD subunit D [Gryllotalpicola sp.]